MELADIKKPFKVEFIDGYLNGAIRYYSTYKAAKAVAKRYCSRPLPGRCILQYPCCEIYAIDKKYKPILINVIN